jgi:hypothetical protein
MASNWFWRWYDRAARLDFAVKLLELVFDWRTWLFSAGGSAVTFVGTAYQGWDPWAVWLATLVAGACVAVIYIAWRFHRLSKPKDLPSLHSDAGEFANNIPDVRIADDPVVRSLFEGQQRDKLFPLLEAGKIVAWGRAGNGYPPPTKIPADIWRTHYLDYYPAPPEGINQTFLKSKARHESTYYDVHLNRSQIDRAWPGLWNSIPLLEAATRAYEQTRDREVSIFPFALADSNDDILTWYCRAMTISHNGKPALITLRGNQPPSLIIEPIETQLFNRYDFEVERNAIILKERHGRLRIENLSVDPLELDGAIRQLRTRGSE